MDFDQFEKETWLEYLGRASPLEIHRSLIDCNFDGNGVLVQYIRDNPRVDAATALITYWMSGPKYFMQFSPEECPDFQREGYDMIVALEKNLVSGFYTSKLIAMNPACDQDAYDWTAEYSDEKQHREIPEVLYRPLQGEIVERPNEGYEAGLPIKYYEKLTAFLEKSVT